MKWHRKFKDQPKVMRKLKSWQHEHFFNRKLRIDKMTPAQFVKMVKWQFEMDQSYFEDDLQKNRNPKDRYKPYIGTTCQECYFLALSFKLLERIKRETKHLAVWDL